MKPKNAARVMHGYFSAWRATEDEYYTLPRDDPHGDDLWHAICRYQANAIGWASRD